MKVLMIGILLLTFSVRAKFTKFLYINSNFVHLHENPSINSKSISTIECGNKIVVDKSKPFGQFVFSKVSKRKGFILTRLLSQKRPSCLQDRYVNFFNQLELGPVEMYYWGKLYDQFSISSSKLK